MGHGKETPRQKMIGMMYLVLTALLALNVSKDILLTFQTLSDGLNKTAENFSKKNATVYGAFEAAYQENKDKVGKWKFKADSVKVSADSLYSYIELLKNKVVLKADKVVIRITKDTIETPYTKLDEKGIFDGKIGKIQAIDDNNVPGEILILKGEATVLRKKIEAYRALLIERIGDTTKGGKGAVDAILSGLNTSDPPPIEGATINWETHVFDHIPLIAVITIMTKIQTDIRNAESSAVSYFHSQIDAASFKFNKLEAVVKAPKSYLLVGGKYEAEVFLAASDTTVSPEIFVGGKPLKIKDGKGQYSAGGTSVGEKKWGGVIKFKAPAGDVLEFPFKSSFEVGQSSAVVSATAMNVFYKGVDNPVEISASGVPAEKLKPTISNGTLTKVKKGYKVVVKKGTKAIIKVFADVDGSRKLMGQSEFRVKRMPDPVAKIANKKGGSIGRNVLVAQGGIKADMENFDFDAKFTVTGYNVSTTIKGYVQERKVKGFRFNDQVRGLVKQASAKGKIYFENITAKGPDGTTRNLATIIFRLK